MPRIPMPSLKPLPGWVWPAVALGTVLSFLPIALIARERATRVDRPRIQIIPDMDQQPKYKAQSANVLFADGRADRPPVAGAVARGEARLDDHFDRGIVGGRWAETFPMPLTPELLKRGQERFGIYCAPCHGLAGYGDGIVNVRAERLQEGTWTPPSSLHDATVLGRPVGHLYNTISNGIRTMPAYGPQIPEADRWAIVAYVRALQRSQATRVDDVPADERGAMR
jgi:prepilin-type processing-associated H-X9-DG protein